jgi:hypothetical protein
VSWVSSARRRLEPSSDSLTGIGQIVRSSVKLVISSQEVSNMAELTAIGIDTCDHVWARVRSANQFEGRNGSSCLLCDRILVAPECRTWRELTISGNVSSRAESSRSTVPSESHLKEGGRVELDTESVRDLEKY